jgi:cytoskeletal protein RodZ
MTIGSELREAREQRGISLAQISERTKIRQSVLRAIENDDFEGLPGSVIMRGFLKLYAREVGLDPNDVGRRYTEQVAESHADSQDAAAPPGRADTAHGDEAFAQARVRRAVAGILLAIALIGVSYLVWRRTATPSSDTRTAAPSAVSPPAPAPSAPAPAATGTAPAVADKAAAPRPDAAAARAAPTAADGLRIDLQVTDACWIAATADGQQVAYRVVNAGERLSIRATKEAVIRIGMPANVSVSINDRPIRPFARPGTPTTLTITPANFRELLGER